MVDMSRTDEEIEAQSNQFIGWSEGYHGRDGEVSALKAEIERLTERNTVLEAAHRQDGATIARQAEEIERLSAALEPLATVDAVDESEVDLLVSKKGAVAAARVAYQQTAVKEE